MKASQGKANPKIVEETGGQAKAFFAQMEAGRKACTK